MFRLILVLTLSFVAAAGNAATYFYQGNNFTRYFGDYTSSDAISGYFELDYDLAADLSFASITADITSFSFTDGVRTTSSDVMDFSRLDFRVSTDSTGAITAWNFEITESTDIAVGDTYFQLTTSSVADGATVFTCLTVSTSGCDSAVSNNLGSNVDEPGTWTAVGTVPVPAGAGLMLLGLAALGVTGYRRRRRTV